MYVLGTNIASISAQRFLQSAQTRLSERVERLSSGTRINRAQDDAAGLGISERLKSQVLSIGAGLRSVNDGIGMAQTTEGALQEASEMLQRLRELSTQAANDAMSRDQYAFVTQEMKQLIEETDSLSKRTSFNQNKLLGNVFKDTNFNSLTTTQLTQVGTEMARFTSGEVTLVAQSTCNLKLDSPPTRVAVSTTGFGDAYDGTAKVINLSGSLADVTSAAQQLRARPGTLSFSVQNWCQVNTNGLLNNLSSTNVRVIVEATGSVVKLNAIPIGVVAVAQGYGNATDGSATSIAFDGPPADVAAALTNLRMLRPSSGSASVNVYAVPQIPGYALGSSDWGYNTANGNYYEFGGSGGGASFSNAKTQAESKSFNGLTGFLSTVTSSSETAFLTSKLGWNTQQTEAWIGGTDDANVIPQAISQTFWTGVQTAGLTTGLSGTVRAIIQATDGKVKIDAQTLPTGVTAIAQGYGDALNGSATSIAIEGPVSAINIALTQLQTQRTTTGSAQINISVVPVITSGNPWAYNPANGHYYEVFSSTDVSYTTAQSQASSQRRFGLQGYLTTIGSTEENSIAKLLQAETTSRDFHWISGSDAAIQGNWLYTDGPETGQTLAFFDWDTNHNQPDGASLEDYLALKKSSGFWHDEPSSIGSGQTAGFIVEYGGMPGDVPSAQPNSRTVTVTPQDSTEGRYYWVSGPESGKAVSIGSTAVASPTGTGYANWMTGEPRDGQSGNFISFLGNQPGNIRGSWNDHTGTLNGSFIVEYTGSASPTLPANLSTDSLVAQPGFSVTVIGQQPQRWNFFGGPDLDSSIEFEGVSIWDCAESDATINGGKGHGAGAVRVGAMFALYSRVQWLADPNWGAPSAGGGMAAFGRPPGSNSTAPDDHVYGNAGQLVSSKTKSLTELVDDAITQVSSHRAYCGTVVNRMQHNIANITVLRENLESAQSRIVDTDYASETASLTRIQILQQAATAMLSQANASPNIILSLLRSQ